MSNVTSGSAPILLAFSGGLDTSFCVPWLKETYGRDIVTLTVDTGGIDADAARVLEQRAKALGSIAHYQVDAKDEYFARVLKFLVMGNIRRGHVYPLCVGAERVLQAQLVAEYAKRLGTTTVAHGCTAAGNDQVRFEVALRTLAPGLEVLAPVRDHAFKRPEQLKFLEDRSLPVPPFGAAYSINRGLWGISIGGKETLTSQGTLPDNAWVLSRDAFTNPQPPRTVVVGFTQGVPTSLDGEALGPVALIEKLETIAAPYGIGRGIHLGDTVIGTKGRVAFEAPVAEVLLTAHRPTDARHSWARLVDTDASGASSASATTLLRGDPLATPVGAPVLDRRGDLVAIVVGAGGGRLAAAPSVEAIESVRLEIRDRFGPLPAEADRYFALADLRQLGGPLGIEGMLVRGEEARVNFRVDALPRLKPLSAAFREVQFQVDVRRVQPLSLKLTRLGGSSILDGLLHALRTITTVER